MDIDIKKFCSEKSVIYGLISLLIVTTLIDIYTALSSPVFKIAESNPIYVLTGSIFVIFATSLFVIIFFIINLKNRLSIGKIFFITILLLYLSFGHVVGIRSNIIAKEQYNSDPIEFTERIQTIDNTNKIQSYGKLILLFMIMPIVISYLSFVITMFFYNSRSSKREKIIEDIKDLVDKLSN